MLLLMFLLPEYTSPASLPSYLCFININSLGSNATIIISFAISFAPFFDVFIISLPGCKSIIHIEVVRGKKGLNG